MVSIILVVTVLLLGSVFGSPVFIPEETHNNDDSLKIINGGYTTINKYPIDVAFLISNNIWGAGVIVGDNWILTIAFNCLWIDPSYITVRVGSSNWTQDGTLIQAVECFSHPNYTGTWANNIALVKLADSIKYGPNSRLGFYNSEKNLNIPDTTYDVSGWGVRSSAYTKETQLQTIAQTILNDTECGKYYNLEAATGSYCASNPGGGPCVFDYGAPMNRRRAVVGLYQGSVDCTQPENYPSLYVDVFQYRDWIKSTMTNGS